VPAPADLPSPRRLAVLKWLARGRTINLTAQLSGEKPATVRKLADAAGWPDLARVAAAATRFERAVLAEPAIAPHPDLRHLPAPAPAAAARSKAGHLVDVPVDQLHPDPDNPRGTLTDIPDLAASMRANGLLQPVIARRHAGRLILIAGHRRLAAARHLGWPTIPCIVNRTLRPDDALAAMLVENNQRADLDPIEEARALAELQRREHLTVAALAAKIGRSYPTVQSRLDLLALAPADQERVRAGDLTITAGARQGRAQAGRSVPNGTADRAWHFSHTHPLAAAAAARCTRLDHSRGRRLSGSQACGACWESVIRQDERDHVKTTGTRTT
jgi:ParB family chromosome partitioning protein